MLPQSGQFCEDMIPTVGFNMRKVTKGNVTIKVSANQHIVTSDCHLFPDMGHRRSATIQVHVGKILSRSECHCVSV